MAKSKHQPNRIVGMVLFPIIVLLWALGWALLWTGSKKELPQGTYVPSKKEDGMEIRTILTKEIQEHNT